LFTQEKDVTIVDPLGSLNNIMKLTRQRKNHNYTREYTQERNLLAVMNVGRVLLSQAT
jgi:hypothetical protein